MLRFILLMSAMFVLPFIAWHAWRLVAPSKEGEAPAAPIMGLAVTGAVLAIGASMALALIGGTGVSRDGRYEPARVVDGEVQPGGFVPEEPEQTDDPPSP
jgi:TRAP-type C4-dicarboxylate transport system permease small subunit